MLKNTFYTVTTNLTMQKTTPKTKSKIDLDFLTFKEIYNIVL